MADSCDMARSHAPLDQVLDALEHHYGRQKAAGPTDPYEMILFLNCGYPATDASCHKGFAALKRDIGLAPDEILAASDATLAALMRLGGTMPAQRAERLKSIARATQPRQTGWLQGLIEAHRHLAINEAQRERFAAFDLAAADQAGLPTDAPFPEALREHVEFGSRVAMQNSDARRDAELHPLREVPLWTWPGDEAK